MYLKDEAKDKGLHPDLRVVEQASSAFDLVHRIVHN